jgi:hypothetical protein
MMLESCQPGDQQQQQEQRQQQQRQQLHPCVSCSKLQAIQRACCARCYSEGCVCGASTIIVRASTAQGTVHMLTWANTAPVAAPPAGHARVYVAFDVLYRLLRQLQYDVQYVRNFTDVDDKIIRRAAESGEDPLALAGRFITEFPTDMAALGCLTPTVSS